MENTLTLLMQVKDGKLAPSDQQLAQIKGFLRSQNKSAVTVRFSKPRKPRSIGQNKLYWAMLGNIANITGHDAEDLHMLFKDKFLGRKFVKLGDTEIEIRKTTTDLSSKEFSEYLTKITSFVGQELGIDITQSSA